MKQIEFNTPVSSTHGNFVPKVVYTVADDIAADFIKAGHAIEAVVEKVVEEVEKVVGKKPTPAPAPKEVEAKLA